MTLRDSWHRKGRRHEKYIEGEEHENHVRRSQTLSIVSSTLCPPRAQYIFYRLLSPLHADQASFHWVETLFYSSHRLALCGRTTGPFLFKSYSHFRAQGADALPKWEK